jgi:hypothetical protein
VKRKILPFAGAAASVLLLAATLSPVRGDSPGPGRSTGKRVSIDGEIFLPGGTDHDDFSTVRREFRRFGIEVPGESGIAAGTRNRHAVFSEGLVASENPDPGNPPPLPPGLIADHTLRLESDHGAVELVLGTMRIRGASVGDRLSTDGWEGPAREEPGGTPRLLEKKTGKETTIVFLDETEGTFLLFRETGR